MKKIFFFALASLALASCSQDEEFVAEKTNGSNRTDKGALSFSTYTAGGTRATDVTSAEVKENGFKMPTICLPTSKDTFPKAKNTPGAL